MTARLAHLPEWRRPMPGVGPGLTFHEQSERRARELAGIRDGLLDLANTTPQTAGELYIALCEEWGDEPEETVAMVLAQLVSDGLLMQSDYGFELAPESEYPETESGDA